MAKPKLQYALGNSASTTLSTGITNTDTTAPLTADTNFQAAPVAGEGMALMDEGTANEELAYSTGLSGGALAIPLANRGLEGGSAQAHSAGASVKGVLTSDMWNDLVEALTNVLVQSTGAVDTTKVVTLTATQTLTNKTLTSPTINTGTLTSPVINTGVSGTAVLDEDDMTSDSATKLATQQSIKAYVDNEIAGISTNTDGWTAAADTWTYASATTFTIAGVDRTSTFVKGTKLKLTQTSAKYFVVVSSSFSTDTTVTVTGGSDYSLANAAITSPYYSYQDQPQGYPSRFAYTPTGVAASNVTLQGRFRVSGNTCFVRIKATFTGAITFTTNPSLPITASSSIVGGTAGSNPSGVGGYLDNGTATSSSGLVPHVSASGTTVVPTTTTGSSLSATVPITWANGDTFTLDFSYEI